MKELILPPHSLSPGNCIPDVWESEMLVIYTSSSLQVPEKQQWKASQKGL